MRGRRSARRFKVLRKTASSKFEVQGPKLLKNAKRTHLSLSSLRRFAGNVALSAKSIQSADSVPLLASFPSVDGPTGIWPKCGRIRLDPTFEIFKHGNDSRRLCRSTGLYILGGCLTQGVAAPPRARFKVPSSRFEVLGKIRNEPIVLDDTPSFHL
jgi:hypothetical protein